MLRFIHISDTHIGADPTFTLYQASPLNQLKVLVSHLNRLPFAPDFVLHTGDVTNDYEDGSMQLAASVLAELKYPIYYVVGNHDGRATMREYLLKQTRSDERLFYDFWREDFHFLVLDTQGEPDPQGYISNEQLAWLKETC